MAEVLGGSAAWLAEGVGTKRGQSASWPFSAPFEAYASLPESRKEALNTIVSAFLSVGGEAIPATEGQPQSQRTAHTDNLAEELDNLLLESSADDDARRQRRRSK